MRSRQRGATFIGLVTIIAILGFALYAGIRLAPLYFEYMAVVRALDQTAKEYAGDPTTPAELRNSLDRRWTVEDINSIGVKEIDIKKTRRRLLDARLVSGGSAVRRQRLAGGGLRQDRRRQFRRRRLKRA